MKDIQAIRDRLKAATPGPWKYDPDNVGGNSAGARVGLLDSNEHSLNVDVILYWDFGFGQNINDHAEADATFIAHAPEDIKALLEEVDNAATSAWQTTLPPKDGTYILGDWGSVMAKVFYHEGEWYWPKGYISHTDPYRWAYLK